MPVLFMPRRTTGVLAATLALLLSACGVGGIGPSQPKATDAATTSGTVNVGTAPEPVRGGTLTVADYAEIRSMDPTKSISNGAAGGSAMAAVYDTLVRYDWQEKTWVPQLAESLSTKDNVTWTLKLRDGTTFSDGTVMDADAVLASIDHYVDSYGYNFMIWMRNVAQARKIDPLTIQFRTRFPWATFPTMLSHGPGMILAPAAYADAEKFKPIGAGPFEFSHYAPQESLILAANDDYVNGRPYLDFITFVWPRDDTAKRDALKAGDVDTAFIRDANIAAASIEDGVPGMVWVTGQGTSLMLNHREGHPTADIRVRRALDLAIDPERFFDRTGKADTPNKGLFPATSDWSTGVATTTPDAKAARGLVKAAKADGWDGKIRYMFMGDPTSQKAAVAMEAMLEDVGFDVVLEPMSAIATQIQRIYVDHDYDIAVSAMTVTEDDPYVQLAGLLTEGSPTNASGYGSREMEAAMNVLASASGPEDGASAMKSIQRIWQESLPMIGMGDGIFLQAWNDKVHGMHAGSQLLMHYDQAFVTD